MTGEQDAKDELPSHAMEMLIDVLIQHKEASHFVNLPEDPEKWAIDMEESMQQSGFVRMRIKTQTGGGSVDINFRPADRGGNEFGYSVSKSTLAQMIHALQLAHDNFIG